MEEKSLIDTVFPLLKYIAVGVGGYIMAAFRSRLPPPKNVIARFKQKFRRRQPDGYFTVLILDLENDPDKRQKDHVIAALHDRLRYRLLNRSLVASEGAMDNVAAKDQLVKQGRELLKKQNADLLLFGKTAIKNQRLRLWFIDRNGGHDFTQPAFEVKHAALTAAFDDWLTAAVLSNLLDRDDQHNQHLVKDMRGSEGKLSDILRQDQDQRINEYQTPLIQARAGLRVRIGELGGDNIMLEGAIDDFMRLLESIDRNATPLAWAATQNNLGTALASIAELEGDTKRLREAVEAYRAALEERTRERDPVDWAATQTNLGNALLRFAELEGDTKQLHEAIAAYEAALEAFEQVKASYYIEGTRANLEYAKKQLSGSPGQ